MKLSPMQSVRLPDFIIGGAPKCGTTSLHFVLAQHPMVGIPDDEVHFFDADDPLGHPDFMFSGKDGLEWYDPRPGNAQALEWYAERFAHIADKDCVGEDSTIYLQSEVAARRIKALLPDVKLIFMLRDPVKRAYSQYWHLVTRGRTTCDFETALSAYPSIILGSTYAQPLRRYLDIFGPDRVKICLFEDFVRDHQAVVDDVTGFLDLPDHATEADRSWFNKTYYPTRPGLQFLMNRVSGRIARAQYSNHFQRRDGLRERLRSRAHHAWFRRVHPIFLKSTTQPPMKAATRAYLTQHLSARNAGLSDMLGRDLSKIWADYAEPRS